MKILSLKTIKSNFKAPLKTEVKEDKFSYLTEKGRIPIPVLPGKRLLHVHVLFTIFISVMFHKLVHIKQFINKTCCLHKGK